MAVYVGYDPAGKDKFGAAALWDSGRSLVLAGEKLVDSVSDAVTFAEELEGPLAAVAIDAPLTWAGRPGGWRRVDEELRRWHVDHRLKVMSPNSLMGAVAVQGPALAIALSQRFDDLVISEAHPKLTCAALGLPDTSSKGSRGNKIFQSLHIEGPPPENDDLIDAVVAAYVAWAAYARAPGWADLLEQISDACLIHPLGKGRSVYFFPARPN